jgi:hypothetical protein
MATTTRWQQVQTAFRIKPDLLAQPGHSCARCHNTRLAHT